MKRHSFRTKNILETHSLVYISIMLVVLMLFFLLLGNMGRIISSANLDGGEADPAVLKEALEKGPERNAERFSGGNGTDCVALFGDRPILGALSSQLMIMNQSYQTVSDLSDLKGYQFLVIAKESLSDAEMKAVSAYVKAGGHVWITNLNEKLSRTKAVMDLCGIRKAGTEKKWPGIRFSGDIALGTVLEAPKYKVSALDLKLSNEIKLFACALPKKYKEIEIEDLPPLIWRYMPEETSGFVYVCNGDFMNTEVLFYMLPVILSEVKGNYVYGILNAYCVFVEGMPYAKNEQRESWKRLYSRDKMSILQDLLSAQYLRYYNNYGARITYFSRDYETFRNTEDSNLRYYKELIANSMGLLARKDPKGLFLSDSREKMKIEDWNPGFQFTGENKFCLPVNFSYSIQNPEEEEFAALASMVGLGFYAFSNDVDTLLDYNGEADVWDEYCKKQETIFGVGQKIGSWIERVSAAQAIERLDSHLTSDTRVEYRKDGIDITTGAEQYWMILKGKTEEIAITGGTAEPIGDRCWLIEVNSPHAVITYQKPEEAV